MTWRVVDIGSPDLRLSLSDNSLCVLREREELDRIPLADLASVLVHAEQAILTRHLISALAVEGIPLVVCNEKHLPTAISLPYEGHHRLAQRAKQQVSLNLPKQKSLWQAIVRQKILQQARLLADIAKQQQASEDVRRSVKEKAEALRALAQAVRSGDPENREAQAAVLYWRALMGKKFRRNVAEKGINAHLNYGYTVVRSCVARAVVGVGLLPCFGIHHRNTLNAFQLVDDVIEPYRPFVDRLVHAEQSAWSGDVLPAAKAMLTNLLLTEVAFEGEEVSLAHAIRSTAQSLARSVSDKTARILYPTFREESN